MVFPCCVAFGPDDSFFLGTPTRWLHAGLPVGLQQLFQKPKAKAIHEIALGPTDAYVATYTDAAGKLKILRANLPPQLESWLAPTPRGSIASRRDLDSMQIALGPNDAFFASDNNGVCWGNLPPDLDVAFTQCRDAAGNWNGSAGPAAVTLGADGTYCYITTGGSGVWNLHGSALQLNAFLQDNPRLDHVAIVLSPSLVGAFLIIYDDGRAWPMLPDNIMPNYNAFAADWQQDAQATLKPQSQVVQTSSQRRPRATQASSQPQPKAHHDYKADIKTAMKFGKTASKGLKLVEKMVKAKEKHEKEAGSHSNDGGYDSSDGRYDSNDSGYYSNDYGNYSNDDRYYNNGSGNDRNDGGYYNNEDGDYSNNAGYY